MKKYIALVLVVVCVLCLTGCDGRSDGIPPSEYKSFEFGNVSKLTVISVDGKRYEVNDTDTIREITENIESIQFEKGESSEDTNGFGPFIQWYDTNDNLIESISVMGEQIIIYDGSFWTATDGNIDVGFLEGVFTEALEETSKFDYFIDSSSLNDLKPMIMIDGKLYLDTGVEEKITVSPEDIEGEILSSVPQTKKPSENGQSNFGAVGNPYYIDGDNLIVQINDKLIKFERDNTD